MEKQRIMTDLLVDLERAYDGSSHKTNLEYTYGFMDALAVIRRKIEKPAEPDPWKLAWGALLCAALASAGGEKEEKKEEKCEHCCKL